MYASRSWNFRLLKTEVKRSMGRTKRKRCRKNILTTNEKSLGLDVSFQQLLQWMKRNGWNHSVQLIPADFPTTGRGLKTLQHIGSGEILVNIPGKLLMTVETASKSMFGWLFRRGTLLSQQVLAAHLVFEKHLCDDSFWAKYILSLPEKIATPLVLSSAEINALPEELSNKVNNLQKNVSELFKDFSESISIEDMCPHCAKSVLQIFTLESFLWAWFVINSRAVYICPERNCDHNLKLSDPNCLALAPYLDMFNHSNGAKVQAFVSEVDGSYQIKTLEPYTKFSEVFIHYGDHSNLKLYMEYGFIISKNFHDTLPVTFEDVYSTVVQTQVLSNISKSTYNFLKSHDLLGNLNLCAEGISWTTKVLIYVLLFSEKVDPKEIQLKAYSNNFTDSEISDICEIGKLLVENKRIQLTGSLDKMIKAEKEGLVKSVSESFQMAIDLYKEYLNVLSYCEQSLT